MCEFKNGDPVIYRLDSIEFYGATFLHYFGQESAYIRLNDTLEVKKVSIIRLSPER